MGNVLDRQKHQETKLQWSNKTGRDKQEKDGKTKHQKLFLECIVTTKTFSGMHCYNKNFSEMHYFDGGSLLILKWNKIEEHCIKTTYI